MKRKLLILLIAVLAVSLCFTACSRKNNDDIEVAAAKVVSLAVTDKTYPTQVNIGETPDFSGIKATATYDDGTTKELGFADLTISKLDTVTTGTKFVTVTYEGCSAKLEIVVIDPEATAAVTGIQIVPGSMPTSCFLAHALDVSKLQVEATYSNGRPNDALAISEYTYTTIDTSTPGEKTFTVTYTANPSLTASMTIKVLDIATMMVEGNSIGSKIFVGETLDTTNLKVAVYYEDGTSEIVTKADVTLSTIDSSTHGTKTLTISYNGASTVWNVVVVGAESLEVEGGTYPTEVLYGATLNLNNIKAYLQYTDGTESEELSRAVLTVGTIDTGVVGDHQLKVSYNGTDTFVTIKVVGVASMTLDSSSIVSEIFKGGTLDTSRVKVSVTYTNGRTEILAASDFVNRGTFDANVGGEQTISITHLNKTITHTVKVCVITGISVMDAPQSVPAGMQPDLSNMKVYGVYNDSVSTKIPLTDGITTTVRGDINSMENKTLVVTYSGVYGTFSTEVEFGASQPLLSGIEISAFDAKVCWEDAYNKNSVHVKAVYTNGTKTDLHTGYTVFDVVTTTAGKVELKVVYNNFTATEEVTVLGVKSLAVESGAPDVIKQGEALVTANIKVTVTYDDDTTTKTITADKLTFGPFDVNAEGNQTLTMSYGNKSVDHTVKISVINGIHVTGVPMSFVEGMSIDLTNLKVYLVYDDSRVANVPLNDGYATGERLADNEEDKVLSVTYGTFSFEQTVYATEPALVSISISEYAATVGWKQAYDTSKLVVIATYENGATRILDDAEYEVAPIATTTVSEVTLTVTYAEKEATKTVTVLAVKSLAIVPGAADAIKQGDAGALNAIKNAIAVKVTFADDTTTAIVSEGLSFGSFDVNAAGEKQLTVSYGDKSVNHTVKISVINAIVVDNAPSEVNHGAAIVLTGMKVYGVYDDSRFGRVELTNYQTDKGSIVTATSANTVTMTVTYGTLTADPVIITVIPKLDRIAIANYKPYIRLRGAYDASYVSEITLIYTNNTTKTVTSGHTVSLDTTVAGPKTLTVTYEGKTATATVQVLPITSMAVSGIDTVVDKGATLNTSGVEMFITFSDGTYTDTLTVRLADGVEVSTPDTSYNGGETYNKQLTVSYPALGATTTFAYKVKAVTGISIVGGTISSEIREGYGLDDSSLMIKITYTTGEGDTVRRNAKEIGAATTGTTANSTTFTVTYEGCNASMTLDKISIFVDPNGVIPSISALNGSVPAEVRQGATLNYADLRLSVTYYKVLSDGTPQFFVYLVDQNDENLTITPATFDTSTTGTKAITFTYKYGSFEKSTSVNVEVLGVQTVEIVSGVIPIVIQGKEVNTDKISIKVTYTNGFYTYVGKGANGVEILPTDTSTVGKAILTVKVYGVAGTKEINVAEAPTVDGIIFGGLKLDELVARESYAKNFKDDTSAYRVGDDNPYYFYLNVIQLDANDNIIDVDGKSIPTTAKIFLVEGGSERELTGTELASFVTFKSAENSYDFEEKAIGKTFRLEILPADPNSYMSEKDVKQSHTVTVVDGYNIYYAWELNVMTNCGNNIMKGVDGATAVYQKDVATEFLRKKGVTRPEVLGGIVLHGNLNVTENDIPSQYICNYERNGVQEKGLYDQLGIFHRELSATQKTFAIYGNYYTVYSYDISPVAHKGYGGNPDDYSSSDLFKIRTSTDTYGSLNYSIGADQMLFDDYKVNIQDIATRDNDPNSNDQSASERHMRGIICYKLGACVANVTNINIEAYQTSMLIEDSNSTLNLNKSNFYNAWQGHLFLWGDNYVQRKDASKTDATAAWARDVVVNITESNLTKCGGPVIIAQNSNTEYACNAGVGIQVHADAASDLHTYVTGQEAWFVAVGQTQLAAQIRAMSRMLTMCNEQDLSPYFGSHGYISTDKIQGVETVNMVMVNMGTGVTFDGSESYNGYFEHNREVGMRMSNGKTDRALYQNSALNAYLTKTTALNKGNPAPVFQSSGGGTAFTDGATGCYDIPDSILNSTDQMPAKTDLGMPDAQLYSGRYISLYYMGVGIMLEYVH